MKRVLALVALAAALAGCQSVQRSVFGPQPPARPTTTVSAPIITSPATPPVIVQPSSTTYTYTQPPSQPTYSATQYNLPNQPAGQPIDLTARPMDVGQRTLLDADRSFSELVIQRGLAAAVASVADPEGTMLVTTNTAGTVNLIPEKATLSSSQDFGQTTGRFVQVLASGTAIQGRYITVWRKTSGVWRVLSYASMVSAPRTTTTAAAAARRR
jgi:hypothetical protein